MFECACLISRLRRAAQSPNLSRPTSELVRQHLDILPDCPSRDSALRNTGCLSETAALALFSDLPGNDSNKYNPLRALRYERTPV
jgi:hypothetical protein